MRHFLYCSLAVAFVLLCFFGKFLPSGDAQERHGEWWIQVAAEKDLETRERSGAGKRISFRAPCENVWEDARDSG